MTFRRFNRLTEDEIVLLKGTEKLASMLSNKFYTDDPDVVRHLEQSAICQWCCIVHGEGYILYFESLEDAHLANQYSNGSDTVSQPPIHSINIVHESN